MADSRAGAGNIQDDPEAAHISRKGNILSHTHGPTMIRECQMDTVN